MDYTLPTQGQDADAPPAQHAFAPPSRLPGRRSGAEVSISEDASGAQTVEYSRGPSAPATPVPTGHQAHQAPGAITFQSPSGTPIMSKEVARDSLVVGSDGVVISSLGALLNAGLISEQAGQYVLSGELAQGQQAGDAQQRSDQADGPSDPMAPPPPVRDDLPGNAEAILANLEARSGDAYRLLEASVIGGKMPSEQDLDAAGTSLGLDRDDVRSLVTATVNEFSAQANQAVAEMIGEPEQLWAWASENKQGKALFETARRRQATERSLDGYRQLSQAYILDLADKSPETVAAGLVAGGTRAFVEGGQVVVDLGNGQGTTSLGAAFNSGLADFTGGRKSRGSRK